jgi:hypothetical protein
LDGGEGTAGLQGTSCGHYFKRQNDLFVTGQYTRLNRLFEQLRSQVTTVMQKMERVKHSSKLTAVPSAREHRACFFLFFVHLNDVKQANQLKTTTKMSH